MIKPIIDIKNLLVKDDKKKLYFVIFFSLIAAVMETLSIASFIPIIEYFQEKILPVFLISLIILIFLFFKRIKKYIF